MNVKVMLQGEGRITKTPSLSSSSNKVYVTQDAVNILMEDKQSQGYAIMMPYTINPNVLCKAAQEAQELPNGVPYGEIDLRCVSPYEFVM